MSFPNPDNYGRSCECGPENTTPPPSDIQDQLDALQADLNTAETDIDTLQADITDIETAFIFGGTNGGAGGMIYINGSLGGVGGTLNLAGGTNGVGGSIDLSGSGSGTAGSINLSSSGAYTGPSILSGSGIPSSSAADGSIYLRVDGGAATTIYARAGGSWYAISNT